MEVLLKVPEITDCPVNGADHVKPPVDAGADQLYFVPDGIVLETSLGVTVKVNSLQTTAVIPVIRANGLTVIVIVKADPKQLPCGDLGVTV